MPAGSSTDSVGSLPSNGRVFQSLTSAVGSCANAGAEHSVAATKIDPGVQFVLDNVLTIVASEGGSLEFLDLHLSLGMKL